MCAQKIWPDTTSYSAAISACEKGKCWELALQLLEECMTWATPNTISYSAAIGVCVKGRQWLHALALFKSMFWEYVWSDATGCWDAALRILDDTLPDILNTYLEGSYSSCLILIIDLLHVSEALDAIVDREFHKPFYCRILRICHVMMHQDPYI